MDPVDFLAIIREQIRAALDKEPPRVFLLGTIPVGYVSGRPTIQFDGESAASTKTYPYLSSYTPAAGDRVLVARMGNGYVVIGKVI